MTVTQYLHFIPVFQSEFKGTNILKLLLSTEKNICDIEVLHAELHPPKFLYWNPNPQNLMMIAIGVTNVTFCPGLFSSPIFFPNNYVHVDS